MAHGLDSDLLRSFVAVAECKGFTAAADRIHRTQSAISQQIRRLEQVAGVTLVERSSRKLSLTHEGESFLAYARQILRLHEEAIASINTSAYQRSLRIGMPDDYAEHVLPQMLPRFTTLHPTVRPHIHCAMSTQLLRRMSAGELDLALTIRHSTQSGGELLCRENLVWVAGPNSAPPPDGPVPLALFPEGCAYRARGIHALSTAARDWNLIYTSQSPTGIRIAVEQQGAVTVNARRTTPGQWQWLEAGHGMPALPSAELELHRSPTAPLRPVDDFAELLLDALGADTAPARVDRS